MNNPNEDCIHILNNGDVLNAESGYTSFLPLCEGYNVLWMHIQLRYQQYSVYGNQYSMGGDILNWTPTQNQNQTQTQARSLPDHFSSKQLYTQHIANQIALQQIEVESIKNREINSINFVNQSDLYMRQVVAAIIKHFHTGICESSRPVSMAAGGAWPCPYPYREADRRLVLKYIHKAKKCVIGKLREYSAYMKAKAQSQSVRCDATVDTATIGATVGTTSTAIDDYSAPVSQLYTAIMDSNSNGSSSGSNNSSSGCSNIMVLGLVYRILMIYVFRSEAAPEPKPPSTGTSIDTDVESRLNEYWQDIARSLQA